MCRKAGCGKPQGITGGYATLAVLIFSGVSHNAPLVLSYPHTTKFFLF